MSSDGSAVVEKTGSAHAFKAMMKDAAASEKETQASESASAALPATAETEADAAEGASAPASASASSGEPAEESSTTGQTDVKGFGGFAAIPKKLAIAFETQNTDVLGLEPRPSSVSVQRKKRKAETRFRKTAEGIAFRALKLFYERIGVVKQKDGLQRLAEKYGLDPPKLLRLLTHKYNAGTEEADPRIPEALDLLEEKLADVEKARRVRDNKVALAEGRRRGNGREDDEDEEDEAQKRRRPKGAPLLARSKRGMCSAWTLRASTKKLKDDQSFGISNIALQQAGSDGKRQRTGGSSDAAGQVGNNAFDALMASDSDDSDDNSSPADERGDDDQQQEEDDKVAAKDEPARPDSPVLPKPVLASDRRAAAKYGKKKTNSKRKSPMQPAASTSGAQTGEAKKPRKFGPSKTKVARQAQKKAQKNVKRRNRKKGKGKRCVR